LLNPVCARAIGGFDEELLEPSLKVAAVPVSARFSECAHAWLGRHVLDAASGGGEPER
jgi:hypothetical protein